jgi:hypothetical protein
MARPCTFLVKNWKKKKGREKTKNKQLGRKIQWHRA